MFGLPTLDLVIGLVFIYFLLSLLCATVQEVIANLRDQRFRVLEKWILTNFRENAFGRQILNHAVIRGLSLSGKPSYIPSGKFALAVLDMVHSQAHGDRPFDINSLNEALGKTWLIPPALRRFLQQSVAEANGEVAKVRADLAQWFDESMERVGGTYKKWTQKIIILISAVVVALFNADSVQLVRYLHHHPTEARRLADEAARLVEENRYGELAAQARSAPDDSSRRSAEEALQSIERHVRQMKQISAELYATGLPIGWKGWPDNAREWLEKLAGLLFTTLAVSLGAPFWFEVLNKLVNLRNAGKKPESQNKPS
jgi:hypothetical protein